MRCSDVFGVTSRLLVINISPSFPAINTAAYYQRCVITCETVRRWPWSTGDPVDNTWHVAALTAITKPRQAQNRDFCLPHLHLTTPLGGFPSEYCHPVWCGKTRMVWLPDSEKKMKISLFVLTQCTNVTDTHTDTQTPHDGIGRAYASHRAAKIGQLTDMEVWTINDHSRYTKLWTRRWRTFNSSRRTNKYDILAKIFAIRTVHVKSEKRT